MKFRSKLVLAASALLSTTPAVASAETVKNIVLVHGAWADGSGWKPVFDILTRKGYHVTIVQEPLTDFHADVAATTRILAAQDGPTILVAHSYGGSVITVAGMDSHVVGLVYVAAHAPDVGENEAAMGAKTPSALKSTPAATQKTADGFTYLTRSMFPAFFAADLPREQAVFEAQSQVLTAASVFTTPMTAAAWRSKPSWGIIAGSDKIISPELEAFYYRRANSHTSTLVGASHSVYESRPNEVAAVIEAAAKGASGKTNDARP